MSLQSLGTAWQGFAGFMNANYQAQVASNNAKIARQNARYSTEATIANVEKSGLEQAQKQGMIRAGLAASGLDVNTGSPAAVQQSQREIGFLDTATVASKGALDVYGYEAQAKNFQAQQSADEAQGWQSLIGGFLGAAGDQMQAGQQGTPNAWDLSDEFSWMTDSGGAGGAIPAGP